MTASECKFWENYIPVTCLIALPTQYVHIYDDTVTKYTKKKHE